MHFLGGEVQLARQLTIWMRVSFKSKWRKLMQELSHEIYHNIVMRTQKAWTSHSRIPSSLGHNHMRGNFPLLTPGITGLLLFSCWVMSRSFVAPWTVDRQALLCMGFSRQEYLSELPFPPASDLPDPGIKPVSPTLAGGFFTAEAWEAFPPGKPNYWVRYPFNADFHNAIIFTLFPSEQVSFTERSGDTLLQLMLEHFSSSELW